jgi:hypothetical protein
LLVFYVRSQKRYKEGKLKGKQGKESIELKRLKRAKEG